MDGASVLWPSATAGELRRNIALRDPFEPGGQLERSAGGATGPEPLPRPCAWPSSGSPGSSSHVSLGHDHTTESSSRDLASTVAVLSPRRSITGVRDDRTPH